MNNCGFTVIDVETASDDSTICQIGIVRFEMGVIVDKWVTYVNPETEWFFNTYAHHITYDMVMDAPTFDKVYSLIKEKVEGQIVIYHMPFVKSSLRQTCEKYHLPVLNYDMWLDSAKMLRRTFSELARSGFGLFNAADMLNISLVLDHHDAQEDAAIAGQIALRCINEKETDISKWFDITRRPVSPHADTKVKREGNPDGELYGETIVFTGALSLLRKEAADLAAKIGCTVKNELTRDVTILVIGAPNLAVLKGQEKSSKQRKAEKLIAEGHHIQLMYEQDFINLLKNL